MSSERRLTGEVGRTCSELAGGKTMAEKRGGSELSSFP